MNSDDCYSIQVSLIKKLNQQAGADIRTENLASGLREKSLESVRIPALFFLAG